MSLTFSFLSSFACKVISGNEAVKTFKEGGAACTKIIVKYKS